MSKKQKAKYPTPLTLPDSEERRRVLRGLRLPEEMESSVGVRKRNCYTPRTRDECVLDFIKKIKPVDSGCWVWLACTDDAGYGKVRFLGDVLQAHCLSKFLETGVLPSSVGRYGCHTCDNPWCVNPDHVYFGTPKTNAQDASRRNRLRPQRGQDNSTALLTNEDVVSIRMRYGTSPSTTRAALAMEFGVSQRCIKAIVGYQNWKHLKVDAPRRPPKRIKTQPDKSWSNEDVENVMALRKSGVQLREIAARTGIPYGTMCSFVYLKRKPITKLNGVD